MRLMHEQLVEWVAMLVAGAPRSEVSKLMRDQGHPDAHRAFVRQVADWTLMYRDGTPVEELETLIRKQGFSPERVQMLIRLFKQLVIPLPQRERF